MINYLRGAEVIEFGHLFFSDHFFAMLTHFYFSAAIQETAAEGKICTWMSQKKEELWLLPWQQSVSRVALFHRVEPVHLRKYVSNRKPEKLFKRWCIIYLYFPPAGSLWKDAAAPDVFRICQSAAVMHWRSPHVCSQWNWPLFYTQPAVQSRIKKKKIKKNHYRALWKKGKPGLQSHSARLLSTN